MDLSELASAQRDYLNAGEKLYPHKILSAKSDIKLRATEQLFRYIGPNHRDNFLLVASPLINEMFMDIVASMDYDELCESGWWTKGFSKREQFVAYHQGLMDLSREIASEIFSEKGLTLA